MHIKNRLLYLLVLIATAVLLRFGVLNYVGEQYSVWLQLLAIAIILGVGAAFVLKGTADIIEETTDVLQERTHLSGGLLQSIGTAFPDMILGIAAAMISLSLQGTDYARAIDYAIIAAATTFGSNIYNIGHAAWCIYRQNMANRLRKAVVMFPGFKFGGQIIPMHDHVTKPVVAEFDMTNQVLIALTLLTTVVALSMVLFGQVAQPPDGIHDSLYQLIWPIGVVVLVVCLGILYYFRKSKRVASAIPDIAQGEHYYRKKSNIVIVLHLLLAGAAILLAAESMVHAIETFSHITHIPSVLAGVAAGIIGCLGEMLVVHNYTIHPKGRIADAVMGVAMDNIITFMGAAIAAILGGIFLGSNALIVIFVITLSLNTILIGQISVLKNFYLRND